VSGERLKEDAVTFIVAKTEYAAGGTIAVVFHDCRRASARGVIWATPHPLLAWLLSAKRIGNCLVIAGDARPAQRAVYAIVFGPIPEGQRAFAACGCLGCANPWHLRLQRPGIRSGELAHCRRGHPIDDPWFVYEQKTRRGGTIRVCKLCAKEARIRYRSRLRAERQAA
jgi:hypothetical protein